jgi:hypothetical protein
MAQGKADAWGTKIVEGKVVGRNNIVVPPQEVEDLASIGCSNTDIANWFGVTDTTIAYNFKEELTKGRENLKNSLRRAMLKNAIVNMNAALQIFLAKNMLGMSDNGMKTDASNVLPFTDEDEDTVTEDFKDELKQEYNELQLTQ